MKTRRWAQYSSQHRFTIVASVLESVEDNLLHSFLDVEDIAKVKTSLSVEDNFDYGLYYCCSSEYQKWAWAMFIKYLLSPIVLLITIIIFAIGGGVLDSVIILVVGILVFLYWLAWVAWPMYYMKYMKYLPLSGSSSSSASSYLASSYLHFGVEV